MARHASYAVLGTSWDHPHAARTSPARPCPDQSRPNFCQVRGRNTTFLRRTGLTHADKGSPGSEIQGGIGLVLRRFASAPLVADSQADTHAWRYAVYAANHVGGVTPAGQT